jgi:hypothetical protein
MRELIEVAGLLKDARKRMRFGEFSRLPLQLLRIEWTKDAVECDWLMRPRDPWDDDVPTRVAEEHQTLQALRDALILRDMVFKSFPGIDRAELRVFRPVPDHSPELVMTGSLRRTDEVLPRVASIAMRARLCGFRFTLVDGAVEGRAPLSFSCL